VSHAGTSLTAPAPPALAHRLGVRQLRGSPPARPPDAVAASSSGALGALASSEITALLDAAGVDYRDCVEKPDLVARLREATPRLPAHVRSRLDAMLATRQPASQPPTAPPGQPAPVPAHATVPAEVVPDLTADEANSVAVFKACSRSTVHITTIQAVAAGPFSTDVTEIPRGTGSGFVWDDRGHIVTNFHVIQGASGQPGATIRATLYDGTVVPVTVVGVEPERDLAVLKAGEGARRGSGRASAWVPVTLGSSAKLQVGQRVYAIGNPFGLDQTLTQGIVSGLGREVKGVAGNKIREVVQTDAAINPGNSGGPLIDSRGRLIGVNTMIFSSSGMFAGVGFAIPVDTVRRVVNQILRYGRVRKAGIGAFCLPDATSRNLGRAGVVVQSVVKGSGADQAGLLGLRQDETGRVAIMDEIVAVGGEPVRTVEDLMTALEAFDAG